MQVLAGLYRSTFVEKMRERFRLMLTGAYAVYISVLEEQSDPALRAHLADVLHEIAAHTSELVEAFEEELMLSFRAATGPGLPEGSAVMAVETRHPIPMAAPGEFDDAPGIREFIGRSIKGYDTRHGSIILALARTFVKLADLPVESFSPPWTPAKLYSAFAVSLDRIGLPIQATVKLALYKMFSQEVLRYLGDGCMDFRYSLPHSLAELSKPLHGSVQSSIPANFSQTSEGADEPHGTAAGFDSEMASEALERCEAGDVGRKSSGNAPGTKPLKLSRVGLALLGGVALLLAGGWLAGMRPLMLVSRDRPVSIDFGQPGMMPTAPSPPGSLRIQAAIPAIPIASPQSNKGWPTAGRVASSGLSPPSSAGVAPISSIDFREKRERLRGLKLKNFVWKIDAGTNELLLTLTLANANLVEVGGIEVVCSQYSESLDFLEAAKAVLAEPVEAGQTKTFKGVSMGSANDQADRINCVVADLNVIASR